MYVTPEHLLTILLDNKDVVAMECFNSKNLKKIRADLMEYISVHIEDGKEKGGYYPTEAYKRI